MKTIQKNIFLALIVTVLTIPLAWSQTYKNDNGGEQLQGKKVTPELLANLGINTTPNSKNATVQGNSVYVQQIGSFNTAQIQTRTSASGINLIQEGDYNDTNLNYTANTAVADLIR